MSNRYSNQRIRMRGLLVFLLIPLVAPCMAQHAFGATTSAMSQKIIRYVRQRFGVPISAKLTVAPLQDSKYAGFYETTIGVQEGKAKKSQPALITKDKRYMVLGNVLTVSTTAQPDIRTHDSATDKKILDYVRAKFKVPADVKLAVGAYRNSEFADFYQVPISVQDNGNTSSTKVFITKDGRYTVVGSIYDLTIDPRKEAEQTISMVNQPTVGPANAPVTIVEFADLECPTCAEMQQFIEHTLLPKYGNKIRIVFKELPLVAIHHWALQAAIANECGYQLNPADYFRFRSIIFESQGMINADNIRTLLLDFGQRAGLNRAKLSQCMASKASLPRVEKDLKEAEKLGLNSTPTLFINGVREVGLYPNNIETMINKDLQAAR